MTNYLEQIFFEGFATKEGCFEVGTKKVNYKFRTLSFDDHQKAIEAVSNLEEVPALVASHHLILEILCYTLLKLDNIDFESHEEVRRYLHSRPSSLVTSLGRLQGKFEREVEDMLKPEVIEEVFSEAPQTSEE